MFGAVKMQPEIGQILLEVDGIRRVFRVRVYAHTLVVQGADTGHFPAVEIIAGSARTICIFIHGNDQIACAIIKKALLQGDGEPAAARKRIVKTIQREAAIEDQAEFIYGNPILHCVQIAMPQIYLPVFIARKKETALHVVLKAQMRDFSSHFDLRSQKKLLGIAKASERLYRQPLMQDIAIADAYHLCAQGVSGDEKQDKDQAANHGFTSLGQDAAMLSADSWIPPRYYSFIDIF